MSLIAKVSSILYLLPESGFDFGKERHVQVPRSFIFIKWLSTNASSRSSKISFETSLSTNLALNEKLLPYQIFCLSLLQYGKHCYYVQPLKMILPLLYCNMAEQSIIYQ